MEMYDVAIIGTGPAGMSAAVTAKIRNKKVLLIGNRKLSSKIEKGKKIQNYLGFFDVSGKELAENFKRHIEGLYACGDIVGTPYQYIKAAGQGNVATLAAVSYLS